MLTTGNDKLNDAAKQLMIINQLKEKILDKLRKEKKVALIKQYYGYT